MDHADSRIYDIQIVHISGTANIFSDALSRNPVGITKKQIDQARKPKEVLVPAIDLRIHTTLKKELKDLAKYQSDDKTLMEIEQRLMDNPVSWTDKYMIKNNVLYFQDKIRYPYWRPMVPKDLEYKVINYVHIYCGHQGIDRCMNHIAYSFLLHQKFRQKSNKIFVTL
jgi:hypothetical protein